MLAITLAGISLIVVKFISHLLCYWFTKLRKKLQLFIPQIRAVVIFLLTTLTMIMPFNARKSLSEIKVNEDNYTIIENENGKHYEGYVIAIEDDLIYMSTNKEFIRLHVHDYRKLAVFFTMRMLKYRKD